MKKISMNKNKKYIFGAIMALAFFSALPIVADAAIVTWNNFSNDCRNTTIVANDTTQENAGAKCWGNSVSAKGGDIVVVGVSYHNTSSVDALNTITQINQPNGTQNSFTFNGFVASGGTQATGTVAVNFTDGAHSLSLIGVVWEPENGLVRTTMPNLYTQSLGTIKSASSCPTGGATGTYCHAGLMKYRFQVSGSATPTSTCAINVFRVNPITISAGQKSNVVWHTSGCANVTVSGLGVNGSGAIGSLQTPALSGNTTYTITVNPNGRGTPIVQSATVSVTGVVTAACQIDSFTGPTGTIPNGSTATLSWATRNCNSVSISGLSIPSNQTNGTATTPALTSSTSYRLTASGNSGTVTRDVFVNVNSGVVVTQRCQILNFDGPTSAIPYNGSATLVWNTQNCSNVSISGLSITPSQTSGSATTSNLTSTTSYTLSAYGSVGSDSRTVSVSVLPYSNPNPNPVCTITQFTPSALSVPVGSTATLYWSTNGCSNVSITGHGIYGTQALSGQVNTGALSGTETFTLTAYGSSAWNPVRQTVTVSTYQIPNPIPTPTPYPYPYPYPVPQQNCNISSFYASPSQVVNGESATLIWNTYGCSSVTVSGGNIYNYGSQPTSGQISTGAVYNSTTYTLTAYGANTVNQSATVSVYQSNPYPNQTTPSVSTYSASNVSTYSGTLNGYISNSNYYGGNYSSYYFQYGTSSGSLNNSTPMQTLSAYSGNISAYVSNLAPNTTYYFRAVAQNSYGTNYGSILSFVTGGSQQPTSASVVTSVPTSVFSTSARLNGIVIAPSSYGIANAYFEYGTDLNLGQTTNQQSVSTANNLMNYYDTVSTTPNTTYYFRAVGVINGQTYRGVTNSFTTRGTNVVTNVVTNTVISGTGTGSRYVMLSIDNKFQNITEGETITYEVIYKNISSTTLTDAVLEVMLPSGVTFKRSTLGVLTTNNTVAVTLGTLPKDASGSITIEGIADGVRNGDSLIATATLSFTLPSTAQDTVVAYALNTVTSNGNGSFLTGLALFGVDFFPRTFLGWIFLIGLIILVVALARRLNEKKQQPVYAGTHNHAPSGHPENLPH
ncbi:MAG: hypothetical protein KBC17_02400 [Candidatus Pacebacteria bacterium]|nr:hypothetical protein [Candidatus Paceibacterota bacterium]